MVYGSGQNIGGWWRRCTDCRGNARDAGGDALNAGGTATDAGGEVGRSQSNKVPPARASSCSVRPMLTERKESVRGWGIFIFGTNCRVILRTTISVPFATPRPSHSLPSWVRHAFPTTTLSPPIFEYTTKLAIPTTKHG